MKRNRSGGERGKGGAGMSVEDTRRTMEAYVQDLLGGPYKRQEALLGRRGRDLGGQTKEPKAQTTPKPG